MQSIEFYLQPTRIVNINNVKPAMIKSRYNQTLAINQQIIITTLYCRRRTAVETICEALKSRVAFYTEAKTNFS